MPVTICEKERCFGCEACHNVCPNGSIAMRPDEKGFFTPHIDEKTCTECMRCVAVCPVSTPLPSVDYEQRYYSVKHADEGVRRHSASGGLFTALSDVILQQGGQVAGVVWNPSFQAEHALADTASARDRMRGSKYVQSRINRTFQDIRALLEKGVPILFAGTPCQVHGLNNFLGKQYPHLYICDLICYGVGSPRIADAFVRDMQSRRPQPLLDIRFRDKDIGWRGYASTGQYKGKKITGPLWLNSYAMLYTKRLLMRACCYACPYACLDRTGDITIGDHWGIELTRHKGFEDKLGVSVTLVNSEKGQALFQAAGGDLLCKELTRQESLQNALQRPAIAHPAVAAFWEDSRRLTYRQLYRKYLTKKERALYGARRLLRKLHLYETVARIMGK